MLTSHPEYVYTVGELLAVRNGPVVGKEEEASKRNHCFRCGFRTPQPAITLIKPC
jgi:hypothetical protein